MTDRRISDGPKVTIRTRDGYKVTRQDWVTVAKGVGLNMRTCEFSVWDEHGYLLTTRERRSDALKTLDRAAVRRMVSHMDLHISTHL